MKNILFDPKCFKDQKLAITNRGELIPCCFLDSKAGLSDPEILKLLEVSKISDYEKIEDILNTPEWIEFERKLSSRDGPWPQSCFFHCRAKDNNDFIRKEEFYNPNSLKKTHERKF
jgi:hypothetical protein